MAGTAHPFPSWGAERESFFTEGAVLLVAPALENSPNHPRSVVPCRLSLAKPLLFCGTFLWIGLFLLDVVL